MAIERPETALDAGLDAWCFAIAPPEENQQQTNAPAATTRKIPTIATDEELDAFLWDFFKVKLPNTRCCATHSTPWDAFHHAYFARSPVCVWLASRGFGGKSFTLALLGLTEALTLRADVNILGGSGEQSRRILENMTKLWEAEGAPRDCLVGDPGAQKQRFIWGNKVQALMASQASVRGPHPQKLRCIAAGSRVATPGGWRDIATLKAGDTVYSLHEGQVKEGRIRDAWCNGWRETVSVDGGERPFRCTGDHKILGSDRKWHEAQEITEVQAVSFVRASDTNGEAGRHAGGSDFGVPEMLPGEGQHCGETSLSQLWRAEGVRVAALQPMLVQGESETGRAMRGLRRATEGVEHETLPAVSSSMDEHDRDSALRGSARNGEGRHQAQSGGGTGGGAVRSAGDKESTTGADRTMGGRLYERTQADRGGSTWSVLARSAVREREGQPEAGHASEARMDGDRASDGRDALVVAGTHAVRVSVGLQTIVLPVYDLSTEYGTFIVEGFVVHNCDEVDEMDRDLVKSALGQPMSKGWVLSQVVLSSTHQYPDGTMTWALKTAAERGWPVFQWCYKEVRTANGPNGWLDDAEIARKREIMTVDHWNTEVELQEPSSEGRAFDTACVDKAFTVEVKPEEPVKDAEYATGGDWAKKVNWTWVVTIRTDVRPMRVVKATRQQKRPWPTMVGTFDRQVNDYWKSRAAHDNTGLGQVVHDLLTTDAEPFDMVGRARADLLSEYVTAIEKGDLLWPRDESDTTLAAALSEHKYCSREALYKGSKDGSTKHHLPDSVSAAALAWRAASGVKAASGVADPVDDGKPDGGQIQIGRMSGYVRPNGGGRFKRRGK